MYYCGNIEEGHKVRLFFQLRAPLSSCVTYHIKGYDMKGDIIKHLLLVTAASGLGII